MDLFNERNSLVVPLRKSDAEYSIIRRTYSPRGVTSRTPRWHHFEIGPAAFQIILTNDPWHHFVLKHFKAPGTRGCLRLGLPSGGILPNRSPSERFGPYYQCNGWYRPIESVEVRVSSIRFVVPESFLTLCWYIIGGSTWQW